MATQEQMKRQKEELEKEVESLKQEIERLQKKETNEAKVSDPDAQNPEKVRIR